MGGFFERDLTPPLLLTTLPESRFILDRDPLDRVLLRSPRERRALERDPLEPDALERDPLDLPFPLDLTLRLEEFPAEVDLSLIRGV